MSRYKVYVTPSAWKEIKALPGRIRQRVRKPVDGFESNPRPSKSKRLDLPDVPVEVRRLRIDRWRVVYVVNEADKIVDGLQFENARRTTTEIWNRCFRIILALRIERTSPL